jgi:hypothetical protein
MRAFFLFQVMNEKDYSKKLQNLCQKNQSGSPHLTSRVKKIMENNAKLPMSLNNENCLIDSSLSNPKPVT